MNEFFKDLPSFIWIAIAVWGCYLQPKAIARSQRIVSRAEALVPEGPLHIRAKNDLLLYRVRFGIVFNNLVLGSIGLLELWHVFTLNPAVFSLYAVGTFIANELTLNILTARDQHLIDRLAAFAWAAAHQTEKENDSKSMADDAERVDGPIKIVGTVEGRVIKEEDAN